MRFQYPVVIMKTGKNKTTAVNQITGSTHTVWGTPSSTDHQEFINVAQKQDSFKRRHYKNWNQNTR